jgi:hypothetical protein
MIWMLVHDPSKPKPQKVPIDPNTGRPADPHQQLNFSQAVEAAQRLNAQVGYHLTHNNPFFLVDIDECLVDGVWNDTSRELISRFPGAAVEVSQSGTGLHIIGSYANIPVEHGCKSKLLHSEYYTHDRFIALTGTQVCGDVLTEHDLPLLALTQEYFPPKSHVLGAEWTDTPRDGYTGPDDDDALIDRMLASVDVQAELGHRASLRHLWDADVEVLDRVFPSVSGDDFDHSSAEQSLCNKLAFWTGCNCERIERLFARSALVRDKWENREDYRASTILGAVSNCTSIYTSGPKLPDIYEPASMDIQEITTSRLLWADEQRLHFVGCVYVLDEHKLYTPRGDKLGPEQFSAIYGGYSYIMDANNKSKPEQNAFKTFTQSQYLEFPKVGKVCFRPLHPPRSIVVEEGIHMFNTYQPAPVSSIAGDHSPLIDLLTQWLPSERDRTILLSYMASLVQNPGVKFGWAPVIQGVEGCGKTLIIEMLERAVGRNYSHRPKASDVANHFNAYLEGRLLCTIDELKIDEKKREELMDFLYEIIGNDWIQAEGKGVNQKMIDCYANFILFTNHQGAVLKTRNDRRLAVFHLATQSAADLDARGLTEPYFRQLYEWANNGGYTHLVHFLQQYSIDPQFDPAGMATRAPLTTSTDEAVSVSLTRVQAEITTAIEEGIIGFRGGWISSVMCRDYLSTQGMRNVHPRVVTRNIKKLGYVPHPGLPNEGKLSVAVELPDGGRRPRLYVLAGSVPSTLQGGTIIKDAYMNAQNSVF